MEPKQPEPADIDALYAACDYEAVAREVAKRFFGQTKGNGSVAIQHCGHRLESRL